MKQINNILTKFQLIRRGSEIRITDWAESLE